MERKMKANFLSPLNVFLFVALYSKDICFLPEGLNAGMAAKKQVTLSGIGQFEKQGNLILQG